MSGGLLMVNHWFIAFLYGESLYGASLYGAVAFAEEACF